MYSQNGNRKKQKQNKNKNIFEEKTVKIFN